MTRKKFFSIALLFLFIYSINSKNLYNLDKQSLLNILKSNNQKSENDIVNNKNDFGYRKLLKDIFAKYYKNCSEDLAIMDASNNNITTPPTASMLLTYTGLTFNDIEDEVECKAFDNSVYILVTNHIILENKDDKILINFLDLKYYTVTACGSALTGSDLKITGITIDAGDAPMTNEEYLFLNKPYNGSNFNIKSYLSSAVPFISSVESPLTVKEVAEPLEYTFIDGMEDAQDYETRICAAINAGTLTSWGPFYLPESDKKLTGTITYTVGGSEMPPAEFKMTDEGDFTRNHTWIVYAYYGDAVLQFNLVNVNSWTDKDVRNHDVYNW